MDAHTIKLFQFTRKYWQTVGVSTSRTQPNPKLNSKNGLILFMCAQCFVAILAYSAFESHSMYELCATFYTCTSLFAVLFNYVTCIYRTKQIFRSIKMLEGFVEKRKFDFL